MRNETMGAGNLINRCATALLVFRARRRNQNLRLGRNVTLPRGSVVGAPLAIGDFTRINGPLIVRGRGSVEIGRYCAFGWDIRIISSNHVVTRPNLQEMLQRRLGIPIDRHPEDADIHIGHNVWVGDSSIFLPGAAVGEGCIIGAGSIVTSQIPPFTIAVGSPAKPIRRRFSDRVCQQLVEIAWWNWDEERILRNREFFQTDLAGMKSIPQDAVRD
jgi:virginiamycin A acetyltransferase